MDYYGSYDMDYYGYGLLWININMDYYGFILCGSIIDQYGSIWISMDQYGSIWINMDQYGSIWIILNSVDAFD